MAAKNKKVDQGRSLNPPRREQRPIPPGRSRTRIPVALQAVFLSSNRGNDVHKPPPQQVASKTFFRNWMLLGRRRPKRTASASTTTSEDNGSLEITYNSSCHSRLESFSSIDTGTQKGKNSIIDKSVGIVSAVDTVPRKTGSETGVECLSPQSYLDQMIGARGYSTRTYRALETAYYNKPTALQQASYDVHVTDTVRAGDAAAVRSLLTAGISPNPCNSFGESLVHLVCRKGDHEILKAMLDCGTSVQVSDDYGRTPLHDACWSARPSFATVELVIEQDRHLLHVEDCRGATPLSYVRRDQWPAFVSFLEARKDVHWPTLSCDDQIPSAPPHRALLPPHSRPVPNPPEPLTVPLARLVASGQMGTEEAQYLRCCDCYLERSLSSASGSFCNGGRSDDSDSESECDDDSLDDSDSDWDDDEMADLLDSLVVQVLPPHEA